MHTMHTMYVIDTMCLAHCAPCTLCKLCSATGEQIEVGAPASVIPELAQIAATRRKQTSVSGKLSKSTLQKSFWPDRKIGSTQCHYSPVNVNGECFLTESW